MLGWAVCVGYQLKLFHALADAHSCCHTLWQPQAEADYRMNGANVLKRHRHHFESCHGNVMNLQSNYHTGGHTATQQRPHVGARGDFNVHSHHCAPLSDGNIWIHRLLPCTPVFKKWKLCWLWPSTRTHLSVIYKGYSIPPLAAGTDTWSCIDMYRSDDNSWTETDGEKTHGHDPDCFAMPPHPEKKALIFMQIFHTMMQTCTQILHWPIWIPLT